MRHTPQKKRGVDLVVATYTRPVYKSSEDSGNFKLNLLRRRRPGRRGMRAGVTPAKRFRRGPPQRPGFAPQASDAHCR